MVSAQSIDCIASIHFYEAKHGDYNSRIVSRDSAQLDNPEFVSNKVPELLDTIDGLKWRFEMANLIVERLRTYPTGKSIEEIFWRSLIQDDQHDLSSETITSYIEHEKEAMNIRLPSLLFMLMISMPDSRLNNPLLNNVERTKGIGEYNDFLLENKRMAFEHDASIQPFNTRWNLNRRVAFTERGFIAWVPDTAQVGDTVQILDGTRIPLLLRKRDGKKIVDKQPSTGKASTTTCWRLIGDVYLHGCMCGEIRDMLKLIGEDLEESQRIKIT